MALFTNKPIKTIGVTPFIDGGGTEVPNCAYGPWDYNDVRWGAGNYSVGLGAFGTQPFPLSVIKSSDEGVTWATVDQTNYPTSLNADIGADVVFDDVNGVLHFLSKTASAFYCKFDMNGGGGVGTWGTATTLATNSVRSKLGLRINGDLLAVLNGGVNNGPLQYSVISGGVFSAAATLVAAGGAGVAFYPVGLLVGTNGVAHVFYQRAAASSTQLWYVSIDASNVIGTPALAAVVPFASGANGIPLQIGQGAIWNDRLLWGLIKSSGSGLNEVTLYEGTPVSAPVWTVKSVTTLPFTNTFSSLQVFVVPAGITQVQLFWMSNRGNDTVKQLQYASYGGTTFGSPIVAWDALTNPCAGDPDGTDDLTTFSVGTVDGDYEVLASEYCDPSFNPTLVWLGPPLLVFCNTPPSGTVGVAYTHTFAGLNGVPPYVFTISAGALPNGLSLATSGAVTGTPTLAGTFNFTVLLTDAVGNLDSTPCTIVIIDGLALVIAPIQPAIVGTPYTYTFGATGGTPPFTFSIPSGTLPTGLTLAPTTGIVSGTPTVAGVFPFTIRVSDGATHVDSSVSICVAAHVCPWILCSLFDTSAACAKDGVTGLRRVADGVIGSSNATNSTPLTVVAGQVYFVEFWLRGSGGANGTISVGYDFYNSSNVYISSSYINSTGSPVVWTSFLGNITVPAGAVTAVPKVKATGHLVGTWCINSLYSVLMDQQFVLSAIRHYYDQYDLYR